MRMESVLLMTVVLSDRVPITLQNMGPPKETREEEDPTLVAPGMVNTFFQRVLLTLTEVDEILSDAAIASKLSVLENWIS